MNKVSVIIPVYNHEKYIARCLRSITSQSLNKNDYEIIVVDDGSTDKTAKAIKPFLREIKLIKNKKNKGLPNALNQGIKKSRSKYIVRLDADDYVNQEFLKFLYLYIQNNEKMHAVACDYYLVDDSEKVISKQNCQKKPIACGIIFKTQNLIDLGLYDEEFLLYEDIDFRKRFKTKFNIHRIPIPLYRYRRHENNITNNKFNQKKFMKKFKKKYRKKNEI
tara:strand:- start:2546 stop:3205 length:660 start_codon:yes stop_codon:yes gene_type:complete